MGNGENAMEREKIVAAKVRKRLEEMKDDKYREFHSGLLPGTDNILGVRLPDLRNFARELAGKDWKDWFQQADDRFYEETMVRGLTIAYAKMDNENRLSYIRQFVPQINNWAVCDCFCNTLRDAKKYPREYWGFLEPYFDSDQEYGARFAAVMVLGYFVTEEYLEEGLKRLERIHQEGYYAKMAVAWAISVYYAAFPKKMLAYLQGEHRLDAFTYKKSLQKILESRRVSGEDKKAIRQMRQKRVRQWESVKKTQ